MGFSHVEFMFMLLSRNGCHSPHFTANELDLYLTLAQRHSKHSGYEIWAHFCIRAQLTCSSCSYHIFREEAKGPSVLQPEGNFAFFASW